MKRKNKNAFTLIELLAVIVILAIIALIATPIILGIIDDNKKDAFQRSVEIVLSTTDMDISNKQIEEEYTYTIENGIISNLEVGIKNTEGMNGKIVYDKIGNSEYAIYNKEYCVRKLNSMESVEIKSYEEGTCNIPTKLTEENLGTLTFNDLSYTYDGTEKKIEVNNLPEGFSVTYKNNTATNVGVYEATAIITGDNNYSGTITKTAILTINKAQVTITAEDKNSSYGEDLVELTYKITSGTTYGNDDLNVTLTKEEGTNVGSYEIIVDASNDNYEIVKVNGIYTIVKVFQGFQDFVNTSVSGDVMTSANGQLINLGTYGIRYQGSAPDNYVYFNCSDYSNPTSTTCELWRIIGVVDGKVKIIKNASIGSYEWDNVERSNNWSEATLKSYLNEEYLTSLETKNAETLSMIEASTWYLRGYSTAAVTKYEMYDYERTTGNLSSGNPEKLENTRIGIMYPSDLGYAALETDTCLDNTVLNSYSSCKTSNWIASYKEWLITPISNNNTDVFGTFTNGSVDYNTYSYVDNSKAVRPTLYLASNVEIQGNGTQESPYQLFIQ